MTSRLSHDSPSAVSEPFPSWKKEHNAVQFCQKTVICQIYIILSSLKLQPKTIITYLQKCLLVEVYFHTLMASHDSIIFSPATLTFMCLSPVPQRVVQVSATTMDGALWKPAAGTASASQDGEGPGVMSPWKHFALMERTMKEVYLSIYFEVEQQIGC